MRFGIIGGTGFYKMMGGTFEERDVETPYGTARAYVGEGDTADLVFMPRHGTEHSIPPHKVNFRANMKALELLEVGRVLAAFAVGSLHIDVPPRSLVAVDQILDLTHGRERTYYEGGDSGVAHVKMTEPYCPALRGTMLKLAGETGVRMWEKGTYVCFQGPRFETAAEVRLFRQLGGDVVGMTGMPEAGLARELGMHYAAVGLSINYAAGLQEEMEIEMEGLDEIREGLIRLFVKTLRAPFEGGCGCEDALLVMHPPKGE